MMTAGQIVMVTTLGMIGVVSYTTPDGYVGVNLVGEGRRVDEWHPTLVRPLTAEECVHPI